MATADVNWSVESANVTALNKQDSEFLYKEEQRSALKAQKHTEALVDKDDVFAISAPH